MSGKFRQKCVYVILVPSRLLLISLPERKEDKEMDVGHSGFSLSIHIKT